MYHFIQRWVNISVINMMFLNLSHVSYHRTLTVTVNSHRMVLTFKNSLSLLFLLIILEANRNCSATYSSRAAKEYFSQFNGRDSETVVSMPRMDLHQTSCKMKEFNETIKRKGCQPQTVTNNFCFGVCHSFYVPNDRKVIKVQDACTPSHTIEQHITLVCRKKRKPGMRRKRVTVTKILSCGCSRL